MHFQPIMVDNSRQSVVSVYMTEVYGLYSVAEKYITKLTRLLAVPIRREVQESDYFLFGEPFLQSPCLVKAHFQPDSLSVCKLREICIIGRVGSILVVVPSPRSRKNLIAHDVSIIIQEGYSSDTVLLKERIVLFHSRPPEIVVALADDLLAGKRIYEFHIGKRFLQGQRPGNISGNNNSIPILNKTPPVDLNSFYIILPSSAEDLHGFISGVKCGKMQVGNDVKRNILRLLSFKMNVLL